MSQTTSNQPGNGPRRRHALPRAGVAALFAGMSLLVTLPLHATAASAPTRQAAQSHVSFTHRFQSQGHVPGTSVFTASSTRSVLRHMHSQNASRFALFGHVVSRSGHTLIVRQIPWNSRGLHGTTIRYRSNQTGVGNGAVLVRVEMTQRTLIQAAHGISSVRHGSTIFVGGAFASHQLSAFVIADVSPAATAAARSAAPALFHAISGLRVREPLRSMPPITQGHMHVSPLDTTSNLNFTGGFGGPSYNYNTSLGDIDIFDIGIFSVKLKSFGFWPRWTAGPTTGRLPLRERRPHR